MEFRVVEIFDSIEGEGIRQGQPATFVRLAGCNLSCAYCDTAYALDEFTTKSLDEIVKSVNKKYMRVTLTGGEPLISPNVIELINSLAGEGIEVNIETNGAVDISGFIENFVIPQKVFFTIDYKLPSSCASDKMIWRNFEILRSHDVIKFVVGSDEDVACMLDITKQLDNIYKEKPRIFIGTVYGNFDNSALVDIILNEPLLKDARFQLQIHKIVWDPNKRGV